MNTSRALNFVWTPWSLAISVVVLIVAAALCYASWRRSGYRTSHGLLEVLRWCVIAFGTLLLNQPEFTEEYRTSDKPTIVVLCDASPSMQTVDVVKKKGSGVFYRNGPEGASHKRLLTPFFSRDEAIQPLLESSTWESLSERMNIVVETFGKEDGQSDLFQSMTDSLNEHDRLLGVVLASDGDWNAGKPPVQAATRMRMSGIPLFAVPVGSQIGRAHV